MGDSGTRLLETSRECIYCKLSLYPMAGYNSLKFSRRLQRYSYSTPYLLNSTNQFLDVAKDNVKFVLLYYFGLSIVDQLQSTVYLPGLLFSKIPFSLPLHYVQFNLIEDVRIILLL